MGSQAGATFTSTSGSAYWNVTSFAVTPAGTVAGSMTVTTVVPTTLHWDGDFSFQVLVITGGLATGGNGNATGTGGSANADITLTPARSKSLLCWMTGDQVTAITYTATANNTIYSQNTTNGFGFGYYSGTVTGGSGVVAGTTQTGAAHEFNNMVREVIPAVAGV